MAFSASNNNTFHERMRRAMCALYEVAYTEGDKLDGIYVNEAASGAAETWVDTDIADAAECVQGIVLIRAIKAFIVDNGHLARITPFLQ